MSDDSDDEMDAEDFVVSASDDEWVATSSVGDFVRDHTVYLSAVDLLEEAAKQADNERAQELIREAIQLEAEDGD